MNVNELRQRRDKAPFNEISTVDFIMYDKLPYSMDINLCPRDSHKLISGNIIKYSTYTLNENFLIKSN
ncbi:MAG: hypothetical protein K0S61_2339 [Anaerocolumna sp.]|jgi:hypothetical protein|nr:hypothetical protein [Anaerocolumna sp.]